METKTKRTKPETPKPSEEAQGEQFFISPVDFFEEIRKRPDIREILTQLAK